MVVTTCSTRKWFRTTGSATIVCRIGAGSANPVVSMTTRSKRGIVPRSRYFKRIVQAHKLHHAVESRDGAVSYGFLYAPPVDALKKALRSSGEARVRAAKGGSTDRSGERV